MNAKITLNAPLAVSTDPVTGNTTEYHSIEDFATGCIDERNLKVKPESYIYSKLPSYNCEECTALPYVNPEQLSEIVGYAIKGIAKKYDTDQTPHKEIDSQKVSFFIGEAGVFASNTNNKYMSYVLGTDNIDLFVQLAKAGEAVVLHKDIDAAYQIINNGMPETIPRMMAGFNPPQQNQDLFVQLDDSFKELTKAGIKKLFLEKVNQLKQSIDQDSFEQPQAHEWGEPEPIKAELLPVQQLTRDMLPTDLSEYVFDNAERADHMPSDFVAVSLLTCLGGLIGARVSIKPKQQDDWEIVPNLWGGIIGNPSMKKSPAFNAGAKPLNNLVMKAKAEAKQKKGGVIAMPTDEEREKAKQAIIEKQKIALELASKIKALNATIASKKTTEEEREKAIANLAEIKAEQEIIEHMQSHADDEAIPEKRYLTNDTSPEALTDLEINNPNGIIIIRDELIGLLSSLTRNGEDTGRAFYLEGWNGTGSYQYDRIVRGAGYIPNHCITLLGGIQPDKLITYLESTVQGTGNDGLLQRFQLLVYPDAPTWKYEDRYPNKDARSAVYELFEAIDSLNPSELVKMGAEPADQYNDRPYFRFSESAQALFIDWFTQLNAEKIANEEHAIIQEHLSKYGKLMPALALIFHIIDGVNFGNVGAVSKASAEMAIQWCEYLEKHARRIYGLVLNSSELKASALALKLQQLPVEHEWLSSEGVTASQILRKNWKHLATIESVYEALDVLAEKHWVQLEEVEPTVKGGRPKKRFLINKKIFSVKNT
ncbi:YfjI family protein [Acinetobacter sp. AL9]|uniref:YfjI family protein n=1 Tax=Acinetobacter sp. AL9 TaxID=3273234 RepID=UPI0035564D49